MSGLTRIVLHWTAGTNDVSDTDLNHYHFVIDGAGKVHEGDFKPEDNLSTADGRYAAHVLNGNTGAIGIALAGMRDAIEQPFSPGPYPITARQLDAACALAAKLCARYGIAVTRKTVLTHAEVEPTLGIKQRGKWDIARLPWDASVQGAIPVGDLIRAKIAAIPVVDPMAEWLAAAPKGALEWLRSIPKG